MEHPENSKRQLLRKLTLKKVINMEELILMRIIKYNVSQYKY